MWFRFHASQRTRIVAIVKSKCSRASLIGKFWTAIVKGVMAWSRYSGCIEKAWRHA